jgi:hypothetical protein
MGLKTKRISFTAISGVVFLFLLLSAAEAAWEAGTRIGYDSNIDRAVSGRDRESDTYGSAFVSYIKGPSGETRFNWAFDATASGTGYSASSDLNYGQIALSPSLVYFPHRRWTITAAPFAEGRVVSDSDQSSIAVGGKLSIRQQATDRVSFTEYYLFRNSTARADTYTYTENAVGIAAGVNWTKSVSTDISYEYSRGDSFLAVGRGSSASQAGRRGRGRNSIYSTTFDRTIVREMIDRHTMGGVLGVDWNKSLFSTMAYNYVSITGDSGSVSDHSASLTIGYRF